MAQMAADGNAFGFICGDLRHLRLNLFLFLCANENKKFAVQGVAKIGRVHGVLLNNAGEGDVDVPSETSG